MNRIRALALVAVVLAVVGGIAWLTQQLPHWRASKQAGPSWEGISFTHQRALWDAEDKNYVKGFEKGENGSYLFPFHFPGDQVAELGLIGTRCDCADVSVGLIDDAAEWQRIVKLQREQPGIELTSIPEPTWRTLQVDARHGLELPPRSRGLVRVSWKGRKEPGANLNILITLWAQPKGQVELRQYPKLSVPAVLVSPATFTPLKLDFGVLGSGETARGEGIVFSTTRKHLDLALPEKENRPWRFQIEAVPTSKLKAIGKQRILCAYKVSATAAEADLDLGYSYKPLTILLDGFPLDGPAPIIEGRVQGEIVVGGPDDHNKIQFQSFRARDGAVKTIGLWTDAKTTMTKHSQTPDSLRVMLIKSDKESTATRTHWRLEVEVLKNSIFGDFPDDSAIFLRLSSQPNRLVRIPVTGNGGS